MLKNTCFLSFRELGLQNLHVIAHAENIASQRVAQKSGFRLKRQFKEVTAIAEKCAIMLIIS